jgi:hypothetical protein
MIDYHVNGNLMGVYGEGRLGGKASFGQERLSVVG